VQLQLVVARVVPMCNHE